MQILYEDDNVSLETATECSALCGVSGDATYILLTAHNEAQQNQIMRPQKIEKKVSMTQHKMDVIYEDDLVNESTQT